MVVQQEIEIWVIGKGGTKREGRKGHGWRKRNRGCWVLWPLCVFGYIYAVVVEGAFVRDCRGLGMCTVDTVG
jgi:hypothetical protein